jgi:hypothetical protein
MHMVSNWFSNFSKLNESVAGTDTDFFVFPTYLYRKQLYPVILTGWRRAGVHRRAGHGSNR